MWILKHILGWCHENVPLRSIVLGAKLAGEPSGLVLDLTSCHADRILVHTFYCGFFPSRHLLVQLSLGTIFRPAL